MKKLTILASAIALFASCTKDAPTDDNITIPGGEGRLTVIGTAADDATRTQFTDGKDGFIVNWVKGEDKIGFYAACEGEPTASNLAYSADMTAAKTSFSAQDASAEWSNASSAHDFYAYYPYNAQAGADPTAVPISVPAMQTQSEAGSTEHLAALDFLYAASQGITKTADGSVTLRFIHPLSILEFAISSEQNVSGIESIILRCTDKDEILSAEGAAIDITTGQIDYSAATVSNQIELALSSPVTLSAGSAAKKFHAQITPGHGGKQLQVIAVADGSEILLGTKFVPASGIPAGRKAVIGFGISSKVRLSDNGTANCYIVDKPSTRYMFNATVKGNGKTAVYQWTDGAGTAMSKTISAADIAIKPKSAKLLWTTNSATATVIENVEYDASTGMISFDTPSSFINGNAVIAAYASDDCSGDVLWSWHIWAVKDYDASAAAIPLTAKSLYMMDRNLGATLAGYHSDAGTAAKTVGMTYQWGRKDPFPGHMNVSWQDGGNGAQGELTYSPDGSIAYGAMYGGGDKEPRTDKGIYQYYAYSDGMQQIQSATFDNDIDGAIAQSVKEPWRFHANASGEPYIGISGNYDYTWLWGNPTGNADGGEKSIYDPCPAGWKVAPKGVYSYIASMSRTDKSYGAYFSDIYLTYTGRRMGGNGFFEKCNTDCNMWSDCAYNTSGHATRMEFFAGGLYPNSGTYPGYAMTVRCVSDKKVDMSDLVIDLSRNGTANCYVVNAPSTVYKFKATVKGNGVNPLSGSASIEPVTARILWGQQKIIAPTDTWPQNNGNDNTLSKSIVYSSVFVKDGYVYFTTAQNMEDANIFIAVMDENNNILWDWHIWCVNEWSPDATAQTVTTKGINSTMLDRNLGAFSNPAAIAQPTFQDYVSARGLYYQWGRKDPFPGYRTMSGYNSYVAWSEPDGTIKSAMTWAGGEWGGLFCKANNSEELNFSTVSQTLDYIAAHPQVFIAKGATTSTWVVGTADPGAGTTTDWGKLWGNQSNKAVGSKTMYDPCPLGYMVPSTNQLRFVTSHNDNISARYAATDPWKLNCKETIYNAAGVNVGNGESADGKGVNPFYNPPYGLNFYIHGVKTALVEGDAGYDANATCNVGKAPADATVSYFPAQGWIYYTGSIFGVNSYRNNAQILIHSNSPSSSTYYGGLAYRMRASHTGDFWYSSSSADYADPLPTGMPVRCVKE